MSKTGYFDTPEVSGFTWRTHWAEKNGVVSVTNLQIRSRLYQGPAWYPKGEIAVNGVPILQMDNGSSTITHVFNVGGAGETWVDITVRNGQALPVSSGVLSSGKAVIAVNVSLYRDSSAEQPVLTGSAEIPLTNGLVQIMTADGVKPHRLYVIQGGKPVPAAVVVKHGGSIKYCT